MTSSRYLLYLLSGIVFAYFSGLSLYDDGLRHIAFAAHQDVMHSWGEVFPHSLFFTEYDPWFVWHFILSLYLKIFPYEYVHYAVNATILFVMMVLLDKLLYKYSDFKPSVLFSLVVLSIVSLGSFRYISLRPDMLSGIFLMLVLLMQRNLAVLFVIGVLYASSYYLFFLYTGSVGLLFIALRNYRALAVMVSASLIGLGVQYYYGGEHFVQTVLYLLGDQSLREGLEVGEGVALFKPLGKVNYFVLVAVVLGGAVWLIRRYYSYFQKQHLALLLVLMAPLWIAQIRYYELLKPLIYLYLFIESPKIISFVFSQRLVQRLYALVEIVKSVDNKPLFVIPAALYTALMLGYSMSTNDNTSTHEQKRYYANKNFNDKTILYNSFGVDIYHALYYNPSLHVVPSCGIGWFEKNASMKDIYIRMMKDEGIDEAELKSLLDYVGADYYFHYMRNKEQTLDFAKLHKLGIEPKIIIDNKILFTNKKMENP